MKRENVVLCSIALRLGISYSFPAYILLISYLLVACQKGEDHKKINGVLSGVRLEIADSNQEVNLTQFIGIKQVDLIPIKLNEQALLKAENSRKIVFFKNSYFILDDMKSSVLVFNEKGEFKSVIGKIGKAPEELISISDFTIDRKENIIYLNDYMNNKIKAFDFDGHFIEEKTVLIKKPLMILMIERVKDGFLLYNEGNRPKYRDPLYFYEDITGEIKRISLDVKNDDEDIDLAIKFFPKNGNCMIAKNFSDSIYLWANDKLNLKYIIPFSEAISKDLKLKGKKSNVKNPIRYDQFLESGSFVYTSCFVKATKFLFIYNKEKSTGRLINVGKGVTYNGNVPQSDFFNMTNSSIHGYLGFNGVVSRMSTLKNVIISLTRNIKDDMKRKQQEDLIRGELKLLREALEYANGAIIVYRL